MKKIFSSLLLLFVFTNIYFSQHKLTKNELVKAYLDIKSFANYPDTWELVAYNIYKKGNSRACLSLAMMEVKARNAFNTPIRSTFMLFFIRGRLFEWNEVPYKTTFIDLMEPSFVDELMETAITGGIYERNTITKDQVCKTDEEIEAELARAKRLKKEEEEKKRIQRAKEIHRAKIRELINNNKISEAAENYSNSEFEDLTAKSEIQKALNNYYSENIYVYKEDFLNAYLNTNKDYFKTLKDGKYTFKFDKYGSPNESKLTEIEYKDIPRKKIFDFTVNLKSEFTIVIKTTDPILIETKYYANVNKPIYYNKNDSFFFKTKMGLPQISSSEFVFDEKIPKNTIKISKTFEVKKYANELLINSEQYNKTINATIFKKG